MPARRGPAGDCQPVIGFVLLFIFGLTPLYYQFELNKVVDRYAVAPGAQVVAEFRADVNAAPGEAK